MNIIEQVEEKYKNNPRYGVQFSIESGAFEVPDGIEVTFDKGEHEMCCGTFYNYQSITINGDIFGFLCETKRGGIFEPICTSFCYILADCQDENYDEMFEKYKDDPHFFDAGESIQLNFATLEQFLQFRTEVLAVDYQL